MTHEEFEVWLDERMADALEDMPKSSAPAGRWVKRLAAALQQSATEDGYEEDEEEAEAEDEDEEGGS